MKHYQSNSLITLTLGLGLSLSATTTMAESYEGDTHKSFATKYNEPSRGFLIERGFVAKNRDASVELHTGGVFDNGGGIRLGMPRGGEVIINSGLNASIGAGDVSELAYKLRLPELGRFKDDPEADSSLDWSAYMGLSHIDIDNGPDFTNFVLGVTGTFSTGDISFTLAPEIVAADDNRDDNFVEVGAAFNWDMADTEAGGFQLGVEAILTTQDDIDDTVAFGFRWLYSKYITIDLVPVVFSEADATGVPGLVRLNASF